MYTIARIEDTYTEESSSGKRFTDKPGWLCLTWTEFKPVTDAILHLTRNVFTGSTCYGEKAPTLVPATIKERTQA